MDAVTLAAANASAAKKYAAKSRLRAGVLGGLFADPSSANAFPAIMATPPTITYSASPALTRTVGMTDASVYFTPGGISYNSSANRWQAPVPVTIDFVLLGPDVELTWVASGGTGGDLWWWWVDGVPVTALPASSGQVTSSGTTVVTKLSFGSSAARRVTAYVTNINGLRQLTVAPTSAVSTPPARIKGAFVGDSIFAGAAGIGGWSYAAANISRLLGVDCGLFSQGGTGYNGTGNTYGSSVRLAQLAGYVPDFIVISGSVNDDSTAATVQASATATYTSIAATCPGVPIIVFGPQPSNATDTLSANRQANNAAVRAAAIAHPAVTAYHDMIGHAAAMPPAYNSATTYNTGDLVTYQGSVWQWVRPASASGSTPGASQGVNWSLVTYMFTGTGNSGTPDGTGSRDVYLYSDGVHPTQEGAKANAIRQAAAIRNDLMKFAFS